MRSSIISLLACILTFALCGPSYSTSFTPLGFLNPNSVFRSSVALGVSDDGSTVVGTDRSGSSPSAVSWDGANEIQELVPMTGGGFIASSANAISADGSTIAGRTDGFDLQATLWDAAHGIRRLGNLPGAFSSEALAISADGTRVVGKDSNSSRTEAFIWDTANGMQGLGDLPGGNFFSQANGISGDGSIVVGLASTASGNEAFIWDAANGMQGLGDLSGGRIFSQAKAISADGSTVVGLSSSDSGYESFIWDATNGMRGLGDLPGGSFYGEALGVSGDGSIVVGKSFGESGLSEAFIWDSASGMQSLQVLLSSLGVDLTDWQLWTAYGISADGTTIIGSARNPDGFTEAFVAVIPEPSTALLFGFGLIGLGARRRALG